jgi:tetratricopeptide (TPR) repeat protein
MGGPMRTLQLTHRRDGGGHQIEVILQGMGPRQLASARFDFEVAEQDREDVRWYLEDYLQYPIDPAPAIASRIEKRLVALGIDLFEKVFEANRDTIRLWNTASPTLPDMRVEVATSVEDATAIPWELLRDPSTDTVLALSAGSFVRVHPGAAQAPVPPEDSAATIRVLLAICRPGGRGDVPFRSVASHLVRLSRTAREAFQLDVLRPPSFAQLARLLEAARRNGRPYHVVHFDGHGAFLDQEQVAAANDGPGDVLGSPNPQVFSLLSPPRPGSHGYLVFEDPTVAGNQQLVDGPALGRLLADTGVPVLVLNACRSAHAELATRPDDVEQAEYDTHQRVRAYGSLAQEVADAGVAGVVAMRYNVYVVTAAQFIGELYAALAEGRELGGAVSVGRKQLAAQPTRQLTLDPRPLQDWLVPVVYEAAPLSLFAKPVSDHLEIRLSQAEAAPERTRLDPTLPADPDVGFYGRDETLLALDRAFDTDSVVLLHAWAGAGKTTTAAEFARWYALTGAVKAVLFTTFTRHTPLVRVLDQIGLTFGQALAAAGVQWEALSDDDPDRRAVALQVLAQVPALWIWDNVEPVAGFPAGTESVWSATEQHELVRFLQDVKDTKAKVLLTSRRDEQAWLGELPRRVVLPAMPMLERVELARAVVAKRGRRLTEMQDWRPLLAFTQGNPLTVSVLVGQAMRDGLHTRAELAEFVERLRTGAAAITDDTTQGRSRSLGASLDYGLQQAFTDLERRQLALLHLFQGFVDADALCWMDNPEADHRVPAVRGLTREDAIGLLDRAAELGLLTAYGGGYYAIHPALPWHFQTMFIKAYGQADKEAAQQAIRAYVFVMAELGMYFHQRYGQGYSEVISNLTAEEANLLHARRFAQQHGWWYQAIGTMQGLYILYDHTGRRAEWERLVIELVPDLVDLTTDAPLSGREAVWSLITQYRIDMARKARDWATAERLQRQRVAWNRKAAEPLLDLQPEALDDQQRQLIRNLAVSEYALAEGRRDQGQPDCVEHYQETARLARRIADRKGEAAAAISLGNAYKDLPSLRNLDQAEHWIRHSLQLHQEGDKLGRGKCTNQLGAVAIERFIDAYQIGAPSQELLDHLNTAAAAYHQALNLLPEDAVDDLAVTYNQLGLIYRHAGEFDTALRYYRESIRYEELQGNPYGAGQTRYNVALALRDEGRLEDALLYANAALRDFQGVGEAAKIDLTQELITLIRQELTASEGGGP